MGHALFVLGPAGSGKSTFCSNLVEQGQAVKRSYSLINLDPAQIGPSGIYTVDLRDYITVNDMMENCDLGPNGGLVAALEEMYENIDALELDDLTDHYIIFDCPGQIELFIHTDVMLKVVEHVQRYFKCCMVYLMESQYLMDTHKYIHGCFCALVSMCRLNMPVVNVISKVDLITGDIEDFYAPGDELKEHVTGLNLRILEFVIENGMLDFVPLNWADDDTIEKLMYRVDLVLQYYDDAEPRENKQP